MEKTVLVVDDDPLMGELMEEILSINHYHVLLAHDGVEAINQTNRHHRQNGKADRQWRQSPNPKHPQNCRSNSCGLSGWPDLRVGCRPRLDLDSIQRL